MLFFGMREILAVFQNSVVAVGETCNHFMPRVFICKMVMLLLLWVTGSILIINKVLKCNGRWQLEMLEKILLRICKENCCWGYNNSTI